MSRLLPKNKNKKPTVAGHIPGSFKNPPYSKWDNLPSFYLATTSSPSGTRDFRKIQPFTNPLPPFLHTSFSSPNVPGSSQLGAPMAFPEGSSVCSGWEALAAVLAQLPGTRSQHQPRGQQLRPKAMPLPRASCCLEGDKPLESVRGNKKSMVHRAFQQGQPRL